MQVKRIHEYKRQLLNIMGIVYRYKKMKEMSHEERKASFVPRVCIFGGKAFATYVQAKRIVKFITDVGATVNHDPEIGDLLKVSYMVNSFFILVNCFCILVIYVVCNYISYIVCHTYLQIMLLSLMLFLC